MTLKRINLYLCDRCGKSVQQRSRPDGWIPEVVWRAKNDAEDPTDTTIDALDGISLERLNHTAHEHSYNRIDSHICEECYESADPEPVRVNFRMVPPDTCSWCDSEEVIVTMGSGQAGYDERPDLAACLDCSPFELPAD